MKKQLSITETENGWMVSVSVQSITPYTTHVGGGIYVYESIEKLQAALPELLKKDLTQQANYAK